jgi:hypothetical protein
MSSNIPDFLNSRNEKVFLELPDYSFCHSSQTEDKTNSIFLGRELLLSRLKNLIVSKLSKTGVYLVTGNRGVGKSSLVEKVINETSLQKNNFSNYFNFLLLSFVLLLGLQYINGINFVHKIVDEYWFVVILSIIAISIFLRTGYISYLRFPKKQYVKDGRNWSELWRAIKAATKEFLLLPNKRNPFLRIQNLLKMALIILLIQIFSILPEFSHFKLFVIYLYAVIAFHYFRQIKQSLLERFREKYDKRKEEIEEKKLINVLQDRKYDWGWTGFIVLISVMLSIYLIKKQIEPWYLYCGVILGGVILNIVLVFIVGFVRNILIVNKAIPQKLKNPWKIVGTAWDYLWTKSDKTSNYVENCNRVYIKINFGHDVLKERDILRLITRTLTTEYNKFCKSIKHRFYWHILALAVVLFITNIFYNNVYKNDIRPLIEKNPLYQNSTQLYYASDTIVNYVSDAINNAKKNKNLIKIRVCNDNIKFYTTEKDTIYNKTKKKKEEINNKDNKQKDKIAINDLEKKIKREKEKRASLRNVFFTAYLKEQPFDDNNKYLIYADRAINRTWFYMLNFPSFFWEKGYATEGVPMDEILRRKENYNHAPINYAWLLIFFSCYLLGYLLLKSRLFTTHYTIKRQLRLLNESITYNVEQEIEANYERAGGNAGIKKRRSRMIADEREIEKELQDILNNIRKIPSFMARPSFVIVFDELDKVTPEEHEVSSKEEHEKHKETMFASDSTRERQAIILKLLSNMKYFLSTANAKFIFIAGREMYDMYLADIADRNNHFGSIFNDVIFVPSFFTDMTPYRQGDITALVEKYVCSHLIPANYSSAEWTLKEYKKYLRKEIFSEAAGLENKKQIERKIHKIIATLQQFIIYLSHTSKGAPKKMIQVFESFVKAYDSYYFKDMHLVVKRLRNTQFFLTFDYYDQYSIGMTSYLVSPVIHHLTNSNIQEHSDKLLVSTLHFVDYLLKFHNHNFSRRNLDISPEIIEINRSPELKTIISDIMILFERTHLRKPIISLYEFKFNTVLAQDIFFISKMDDRFSAQFNFSLDESLELKHYYQKLLKEKQAEYKEFKNYGGDYVSSIASLQFVLGDLHFLDDELDKAALYYKDSLHLLHEKLKEDVNKENLELIYLFIRNQLKLAYLYEKRKQPEFAYLLYGDIVKLLVKVRDFDLKDIGIDVRQDGKEFIMIKQQNTFAPSNSNDNYSKFIETPPYQFSDEPIYNNYDEAKVRKMNFSQITTKTQEMMYKNMTFEGLQLVYLPLLAKLQILEKRYSAGILKRDVDLIEKEFEFLIRTIKHSELRILTADFYSKIGDILYYKNNVWGKQCNTDKFKIHISNNAYRYYKKAFIGLILDEDEDETKYEEKQIFDILKEKAQLMENQTNAKYCSVMARVFSNLGDYFFQLNPKQCQKCNRSEKTKCDFNTIYEDGIDHARQPKRFWESWWDFFNSNISIVDFQHQIENLKLDNIEYAFIFNSLSMKFYERANLFKQSAFQITKILSCFKYYYELKELSFNLLIEDNTCPQALTNSLAESLWTIKFFFNGRENGKTKIRFNIIAQKALRSVYTSYNNLHLFEILKRRKDYELFNKPYGKNHIPLYYIQVDGEISRIRIITKGLELNFANNKAYAIKNLYAQYITSPYHINYCISARVYRLKLKATLNWKAFEVMKNNVDSEREDIYYNILKILTKTASVENNDIRNIFETVDFQNFFEVLEMLIADSIFCFVEILRLIKTAGDSYLFGHGFFAKIYNHLAVWANMYESFNQIENCLIGQEIQNENLKNAVEQCVNGTNRDIVIQILSNKKIDEYLVKFLGKDFRKQISGYYFRQQALSHYYQSIETHSGGRAYLNMLEKFYFIKGDYDDATGHFNVAVERFRINNTDVYSKNIKELEEISKLSSLFDMENYFEKQNYV